MMNKMPTNYEAVINAAREKHQNHTKLEGIRSQAKKIVESWDKLTETQKKTIRVLMPLYDDYVEVLRSIV